MNVSLQDDSVVGFEERIIIEDVQPTLDGGRYPIKKTLGDKVCVTASIFMDGHDALRALLLFRRVGSGEWRSVQFATSGYDDHHWAEFLVDELGRWEFRILAGPEAGEASNLGDAEASAITTESRTFAVIVDRPIAVCSAWYEFFPRSQAAETGRHGTFRDAEQRLQDIASLGFDVVYLPPIHPIGETARKGKDGAESAEPGDVGSPWAVGSSAGGFDAVHPELGTLDDFRHFARRARGLGLEVALEYALQCSPDHPWVKAHPEWFHQRSDGSFRYPENPPHAYRDVCQLNLACKDRANLWQACRDVLCFWIEQGVSIFRVDNPHTKPFRFWEWLVGDVQRRHPEVVFLSESFTRPARLRHLAKIGMNQSYTYFTWKNTAAELREHLSELTRGELPLYCRPNLFTNTPDVLHAFLQTGGPAAFRIRLLLAATLAPAYGIYSGFELCESLGLPDSEEYRNSEKFEIRTRDWHAEPNLRSDLALLNRVRRQEGALRRLNNLTFLETSAENILAYHKSARENDLVVVVNLDPHHATTGTVYVPRHLTRDRGNFQVTDLLTGESYEWRSDPSPRSQSSAGPSVGNYVELDPARAVGHIFAIG